MRRVLMTTGAAAGGKRGGGGARRLSHLAERRQRPAGGGGRRWLSTALTKLAAVDARQASIVEMRYFGGMTVPEVAGRSACRCAPSRAVDPRQAWLKRELHVGRLSLKPKPC
jgi:hypothetical protein